MKAENGELTNYSAAESRLNHPRCIGVYQYSIGYRFQTTLFRLKVKSDHSSKFSNLSNWKEEA